MQRYPLPDMVNSQLTVVSFHSCYTSFSSVLWCFLLDFMCALDHSSNAFAFAQVLFCHPKISVRDTWSRSNGEEDR